MLLSSHRYEVSFANVSLYIWLVDHSARGALIVMLLKKLKESTWPPFLWRAASLVSFLCTMHLSISPKSFYTPANAGRIPLGLLTNSAVLLLSGMWPLTTFNTIILEPVSDSVVIHQYTQLCRPLLLLSRQQLKHDCVFWLLVGK